MVRVVGLEPTLCRQKRILSPSRLPIPPHPLKKVHPRAPTPRRTERQLNMAHTLLHIHLVSAKAVSGIHGH